MVTYLQKRKVILVKEESVYGTDPTPVPASNSIDAQDITVNYQGEVLERNLQRSTLSKNAPVIGKRYIEVQFSCELKGSGAVGTAPQLGDLLEACGFAETVSAGSSVVYLPTSDSQKSVTIYVYEVGDNGSSILNKITGARGNVSFQMDAGQIARASFSFQGIYNAKTDVTTPTGMSYESTKPPIVESASFEFNSVADLVAQSVSIDMGNEINPDDDISSSGGVARFSIIGRAPNGSFNPEATQQSTIDYQTLMLASTEVALSMAVGSVAGNICTITAPKVTIDNVSQGDRGNKVIDELPIRLNADSGDDEIELNFT